MTTRIAILCALAGLACGAVAGPARGDGAATFGAQWWTRSAPEARFREFRDVPQGPFLESFFFADSAHRGLQYSLFGANVIRRDQSERLRVYHGARGWFGIDNQEVPHRWSEISQTAFNEVAPGVWRLPDSLQALIQRTPSAYVPTMRDALSQSHRTRLDFQTDIGRARAGARPVRGLVVEVRGERRLRSGYRPYGAPFGFNSTFELPEPIEQRMFDADAIASFVRNRLSVQASAGVSAFQNRLQQFVWDNPKTLTDAISGSTSAGTGTSQGRIAMEPDNQVVRGQLQLGFRLPARTVFTGTVGMSQNRQNQAFLPMTINRAILDSFPSTRLAGFPERSLDGKANLFTQDYRLTGRPLRRVSATLRFEDHQYVNRTRSLTWPGEVILDEWFAAPDSLNPLRNPNYSNRQMTGGVDLVLQVFRGLTLNGTAEVRHRTRTFREVNKDDEAILGVGAILRPLDAFLLQGSYQHGNRTSKTKDFDPTAFEDIVQLDTTGAPVFEPVEQLALRRFDVANRKRDVASAAIGWSLGTILDLEAEYGYGRDRYPDTFYGLQDALDHNVTAEATLHLDPRTDLTGGIGQQELNSRQRSQSVTSSGVVTFLPESSWTATLKDRNTFVFARAAWRGSPRWTLTADYSLNRDRTFFDLRGTVNVLGTAPRFPAMDLPPLLYRRHTAIVEARYRVRRDTDIAARYGYDQYTIHDFSTQSLPLLAISVLSPTQTAVYLGNNALSYRAHQVAVVATRRF